MSTPTPGPDDRATGPVDPVPAGSERPTTATPAGQDTPAAAEAPAATPNGAAPDARSRRRWRPGTTGRRLIGAGAVLALLVVGGVLALLLVPGGGRGGDGPGRGGPGFVAEERGMPGGPGGHGGPGRGGPGRDGPWRGDDGPADDGPGAGGRGGVGPGAEGRGGTGAGAGAAIVGTVRSVGAGTLVVARDGAGDVPVRTDDRTRVDGVSTELTALTPGQRVVVRVAGTGADAVATSVATPQARVTGTVTLLVGARATVVEPSGLSAAVDVTGLTTKPSVGTRAEFSGVATANGTVLRAEQMQTLPEPR